MTAGPTIDRQDVKDLRQLIEPPWFQPVASALVLRAAEAKVRALLLPLRNLPNAVLLAYLPTSRFFDWAQADLLPESL